MAATRAGAVGAVRAVVAPAAPATGTGTMRGYDLAKRLIDVVGALVLLLLVLPVLAAAALAVRLHDGGPALFRQTRVGRGGRPFTMLKLRTMVADAEERLPSLAHLNARTGYLFKIVEDPRVTPVGRLLRATSLDELPQLWNVLRGDMSLVGPRPALPSEVARFAPALHRRHAVRPGITGLWQVSARDEMGACTLAVHDLHYVERRSLALDLRILVRTTGAVTTSAARQLRRASWT